MSHKKFPCECCNNFSSLFVQKNSESLTPVSPPNSVLLDALKEAKTARLAKEETIAEVSGPQMSGYQSSIHDLSPTLWHALDVWRCSDHLGKGFHQAVRALSHCGSHLATEHWYIVSPYSKCCEILSLCSNQWFSPAFI